MEGGGDSGWVEQTGDAPPPPKKKGGGGLSGPFRPESSSPGRAISYSWRATFRGWVILFLVECTKVHTFALDAEYDGP